ncbi:uncharacterized mitochondrial protein AtMg00810-like [Nicotiana sylvestris]|uniref:uncharacterized mitochondrial protein AtMg00810-like n=1 Tax=Nicotiana sylvestris TaxID=4096 RepID=UPI00388C924C
MARLESIQILLAFTAHKGFKLYQMDVKSFKRGNIDTTLFIKQSNSGDLITQIYVDDIIFGSPNTTLSEEFALSMKGEFEMSTMGELTFFLGLQIKQSPKGIFISKTKYTKELIKKFGMENSKAIGTLMSPTTVLDDDNNEKMVDETMHRRMIGSLLYLTASRPNIMFSIYSNFTRDKTDRKSTSGTCQLLGNTLVSWHSKK